MYKKERDDQERETREPIMDLVRNAIKEIKGLIDSDVVVGKQIRTSDDKVIVPISRVSVGFVAGGGEYKATTIDDKSPYAGGSGAGFSIIPMGLVVINGEEVKLMKVSQAEPLLKLLDIIPDVIKTATDKIKGGDKENEKL